MNGMLDGLTIGFAWVVRSSWQGALLVVFILAVQGVLRGRLSAGWRHALWGLLIARLLLVWAPPAPWSVYNVAMPGAAVTWETGPERGRDPKDARDEVRLRNGVEKNGVEEARYVADAAGGAMMPGERDAEAVAAWTPEGVVETEIAVVAGDSGGAWPWRAIAELSWLGVAGMLGGAMLWQTLRFTRQVHAGRLVTNSDALELLEECRAQLGVGTYLALVETDGVRSPALLGCIRPRLLMPRDFLDGLSREEMRHVFLHELAHVKRGDIWSSWAINLLTAVHWFNPLIWLARRRFIADREAACDAHVLSALDEAGQRAYGHTVLNLMQRFNTAGWAPGIAGISENNSNLKRRIVMIKHFRTPSRLAAWVGAGMCVGLGLVTLTDAQERIDLDALRQEAGLLAAERRYIEAIELLSKGRVHSEAAREEFSGLIVRYKLSGDITLTAEEREYVLRELEANSDTDAKRPASLLRPAADVGNSGNGQRYTMKNGDDDWVYYQSMESDEGPKLLLERGGSVESVPAARDSVLISYLANGSYSAHQQLSVNLNDKNRVLIVFNLPAAADQGPLECAILRLELRQSGKPTAAPFAMAVHRITEPWDNATTWYTQPPFDDEPSTVVMVPPEPGTADIDVTDLVNGWLTGDVPNYGLVLRVEEPFYGPVTLEASSSNGLFSETEIREMPIDELFKYMVYARVGYHEISARLALAERATLDSESHGAIIGEATRRLRDAAWGYERWCCAMLLGTIGDVDSAAPLAETLNGDAAPGVREGAAVALGLINAPEARAALEAAAGTEGHPRVREAIGDALDGAYHVGRREAGASVGSADAAKDQAGERWVQRLSVREARQLDSGEVIPSSSAAFYQREPDEVVDN